MQCAIHYTNIVLILAISQEIILVPLQMIILDRKLLDHGDEIQGEQEHELFPNTCKKFTTKSFATKKYKHGPKNYPKHTDKNISNIFK